MYPNIRVEMARRKMTRLELSDKSGIKYGTLNAKLNGDSEFTFAEAVSIKRALGTGMALEKLFEPDEPDESEND